MSEQEFNQIFSNNLKRYMEKYDISRAELAKRLNVSLSSVGFWCAGTKCPRMDKIDRMCEIFGCLRKDLLEDHSSDESYYINPETAQAAQEIFENKELRLLFDAARDASPEDLMTAYNVILALKKKEQGN